MSNVIVVNENDEILGTMPKEEAHKNGTLHRIAVTYVENSKGEILVQNRTDGYLDHSSAGHVDVGESYEEAAKRELAEELGIGNIELKRLGHGMTHREKYPGTVVSHVFDIFSCIAEPGKLQEDEVKSVYWADPKKVWAEMQQDNDGKFCGGFIESLKIYLDARS
ncbi:MAG: NUDIX domain-containing protein [Patescibacteria group bacterium]